MQTETIERIPKGRDFTSVVATAPGAQSEAYSGGLQVDGASGSENRFILDGMDTTALQSGTSNKTVFTDFIQEVQVKSSGYNAEFGGATGGVVSAITKSGSNAFRGSVGTYFTSDALRADNRDLQRINPFDDETVETVRSPVDDRTYWNPVFDLGGPVLQDRIWFYGGYAWSGDDTNRTVKFLNSPTHEQRTYSSNSKDNYLNWNVNTQLSSDVRLKVSGANTFGTQRGTLPTALRDGFTYEGEKLYGYSDGSWSADEEAMKDLYERTGSDTVNNVFSANLDWVLTPTLFTNITAGSYRYNTTTPADFAGQATRHYFSTSNVTYLPGVIPDDLRFGTGYQDVKTSARTEMALYSRMFLNANTIWYKSLGGQHTFKAGMRYERVDQESNDGEQFPRIMLSWNSSTTDISNNSVRGPYGYFRVRQIVTLGRGQLEQLQLLAAGCVDDQQQADDQRRRAGRERVGPVLHQDARCGRHRVRLRRQDRPARGLRLRRQGRQPLEALRQLTATSSTSRSCRCRWARSAPTAGSTTTSRSTPTTGRRSTARTA